MLLIAGGIVCGIVVVFLLTGLTGAPYVPSHRKEVRRAFAKLRPVSSNDMVLDIGSGDGVVLIEAARQGARAVGYEINPFLVAISRWRVRRYSQKVSVRLADFWLTRFPEDVTVVYTFGESRDIAKMYAKVQKEAATLGRSIDFVSYGFRIPDIEPRATLGAHILYEVTPLQASKAQV